MKLANFLHRERTNRFYGGREPNPDAVTELLEVRRRSRPVCPRANDGSHSLARRCISRYSHALAKLQCRRAVRSGTPSARAASSLVNPA